MENLIVFIDFSYVQTFPFLLRASFQILCILSLRNFGCHYFLLFNKAVTSSLITLKASTIMYSKTLGTRSSEHGPFLP